jgi:hypothetical protein
MEGYNYENESLEVKLAVYICMYLDSNRYFSQELIFSDLSNSLILLAENFLEKNSLLNNSCLYLIFL